MLHPQQENVTPPSVKPRRLSFSLRTVFVIVTLLCVLMAWMAVIADRARRQERAVAKIGELGGYIYFDYGREPDGSRMQVDNFELRDVHGDVTAIRKFWAPTWLRKTIGEEFFRSVTMVNLGRRADARRPERPRRSGPPERAFSI